MLNVGMSSCAFALTEENFKKLKETGIKDIEISLGYENTEEEITYIAAALIKILKQ